MAITWREFHGGYNNTGNFNNVVLAGAPGGSGFGGVPLSISHASNVGYGVGFDGTYESIDFRLNLVGIATNDSGVYLPDQRYVHYGGTYDWFIDIQYSTNSQSSWNTLVPHTKIFSHDASQDWELCYRGTWLRTAQNSQWVINNLVLPKNTTHVRISLTGDNPTQSTWVVYPIDQIIPEYTPMSIRKSGVQKSLDKGGIIRIRKNGSWVTVAKLSVGNSGKPNVGTSRIRKSGTWLQQAKIGN